MVPWLKVACFPSLMEGVFDSQRSLVVFICILFQTSSFIKMLRLVHVHLCGRGVPFCCNLVYGDIQSLSVPCIPCRCLLVP